jgi:hypothetical protein
MTLNLNIALPGGLDDLLRAGAGSQPTGTCTDTNGISLAVILAPQGSFMDQGLTVSADGKTAYGPVYASQFTELQAVERQFESVGADYLPAASANLTFPNGDVAAFTFVAASQPGS